MNASLSNSLGGTWIAATSRTRQLLRRHLWLWPLLTILALCIVGWWIHRRVERSIKTQLATNLETLLDADLAALHMWLRTCRQTVDALALAPAMRPSIEGQLALAAQPDGDAVALVHSAHLAESRRLLQPYVEMLGFERFVIINPERKIISATVDDPIGKQSFAPWQGMLDQALAGHTTVTRPFPSAMLLPDDQGNLGAGRPTMFAAAPIHGEDENILAVLALRMSPDKDFTRIMRLARSGESGETYAFDANGLLVSQSRFDDQLKQIGLLPDRPDVHSIMNIQIRNPGVDITQGQRPTIPRDQQPLTRMAAAAIGGQRGVDVDGYNDYRGVPVIGAWAWLPEYGFGVATEVDAAEAFQPLFILQATFWTLFVLLAVCALAALVFVMLNERLRLRVRKEALKAKQLGQYRLDEKLGEGGMGVVYRAHHAMMQRPTAVKMLHAEQTSGAAIARFEREVQLCSQLNHPNTIAIYDYGRTPEGLFYYAMEYLDGIALDQLVERYGPQGEGRVIHLLRQVCGSLAEAHERGLIHRDIKPGNIMVNCRGGLADVVKVLDFGLVKATGAQDDMTLTRAGTMTGTPAYLSPEGIDRPDEVDTRSDLYAVGAVGYFLLTGTPPFQGKTIVELCMQHAQQQPQTPSERLGKPIATDLETVILACLAKSPEQRPASARALAGQLANCAIASPWDQNAAVRWWSTQELGSSTSVTLHLPEQSAADPTQDTNRDQTILFEK